MTVSYKNLTLPNKREYKTTTRDGKMAIDERKNGKNQAPLVSERGAGGIVMVKLSRLLQPER